MKSPPYNNVRDAGEAVISAVVFSLLLILLPACEQACAAFTFLFGRDFSMSSMHTALSLVSLLRPDDIVVFPNLDFIPNN